MTYPIKAQKNIPVGQSASVTFAPSHAGLVKAIAKTQWDSANTPPGDQDSPKKFSMSVRLDLFKPGSATPVATASQSKIVGSDPQQNLGVPEFVAWADAMAGAADAGLGQPSDALAFRTVTRDGDGKTQILQLRNVGGRLGMVLYAPQPGGGYAATWSRQDLGQGAGAIDFLPVTMSGDGRTQLVQLWNNAGRLGLIVYGPQPDGSYDEIWGTADAGHAADALAFLPVRMKGDGRAQILQLSGNASSRLGYTVYSPKADGSYALSWSGTSVQGAGAIRFLPVSMHGDGRTQVAQLWNNGGRLGLIIHEPQPDGSYASGWGTGDLGQGADALAFMPVTMNGDGKTQIVQLWNNSGRLGITVYAPQADGSWKRTWSTPDVGQGSGAVSFLPIDPNGDGRTHIAQVWDAGGQLGLIVYAPRTDGSYDDTWGTAGIGQPTAALAFLPVVPAGDRKSHLVQLRDDGGRLEMVDYAPLAGGPYAVSWTSQVRWEARITNTGHVPVFCDTTVRYQTMAGELGKIDHIVVMMMENRSFDHMLGYLSLEGGRADVNGLAAQMSNPDAAGLLHPVHHRTDTTFRNDLGHGFDDVKRQLNPTTAQGKPNMGFVTNFADVLDKAAKALPPVYGTRQDQARIAGGESRQITFRPLAPGPVAITAVADRVITNSDSGQFGSIVLHRPGKPPVTQVVSIGAGGTQRMDLQYTATQADLSAAGDWSCVIFNGADTEVGFTTTVSYVQVAHDTSSQEPAAAAMSYYGAAELPAYDMLAREYAICDRWFASLPTDTWPNRQYALSGGSEMLDTTPSSDEVASHPPDFKNKTIFEVLEQHGEEWKIFFHDLPFALVYPALARDARYTRRMRAFSDQFGSEMLRAIQSGDLPGLTWIDPNFSDVREVAAAASDDHPPGDITNGQRLVSKIYSLLSASPAWTKTMFVIFYDEHGGFFDHVTPPGLSEDRAMPSPDPLAPMDDDPAHRRYGVRVPAIVVSPWTPRGFVAKDTFDHTSVLATVLRRFCPDAIASLGLRVSAAKDLGTTLARPEPRKDMPAMPGIAPSVGSTPVRLPDSFGHTLRVGILGMK